MFRLTIILLASSAVLSGCALTVSKAALDPQAGVSVERSLEDVTAARAIRARMLRAEGHDLNDVSVDVVKGIVVLAGATPNAADKKEAERIAWSAPGVAKVGNEIYVGRSLSLGSKTKDELISTAVRTRMATSNNVRNLNYTVETRDGVVYLMGVARSQAELEEAARLASITKGVREVISYASVRADMPNAYGQGTSGQSQADIASINRPAAPMPYSAPSQSLPYAPPATAQSQEDIDFWGTPVDAPPLDNAALGNVSGAPIDPTAPLPYRPGMTELDPDALDSGKPILRDVLTGEEIVLPPGVEPLPYIPDGPGSLGAGGAPLPPGAVVNPAPLASPADPGPVAMQGESVRITEPYTVDPKTGERIPVKWDGTQWVGIIR